MHISDKNSDAAAPSLPGSTLPPVSGELAPLLRCSAFLGYARSLECDSDARFLLMATDYAIFYSTYMQKLRSLSQQPGATATASAAAAADQERDNDAANAKRHLASLLAQLDAYAASLRNIFFALPSPSTSSNHSESNTALLSLLRATAPPVNSLAMIAISTFETRQLALLEEAEKITKPARLPSPAPPSLFKASFLLVEEHLLTCVVPLFDAKVIRNARSRLAPAIVCAFAMLTASIIVFTRTDYGGYQNTAFSARTSEQAAQSQASRSAHMYKLLVFPLFVIAALAFGQAYTRFSVARYVLHAALAQRNASDAGGAKQQSTLPSSSPETLSTAHVSPLSSTRVDAPVTRSGENLSSFNAMSATSPMANAGAASNAAAGASVAPVVPPAYPSAAAAAACANCPMLRTRAAGLRRSRAIMHSVSSLLFAVLATVITTFIIN